MSIFLQNYRAQFLVLMELCTNTWVTIDVGYWRDNLHITMKVFWPVIRIIGLHSYFIFSNATSLTIHRDNTQFWFLDTHSIFSQPITFQLNSNISYTPCISLFQNPYHPEYQWQRHFSNIKYYYTFIRKYKPKYKDVLQICFFSWHN